MQKEYTSGARKTEREGEATKLTERIRRGIEDFHQRGHLIEWIGENRCKVPSTSKAGRFHLVIFGKDGERCGCPDKVGDDLGTCRHRVSALISWAKKVEHYVAKAHSSRLGSDVWNVVETRAGVDRVVGTFLYVGTAYHAKWALESDHGRAA